MAPPSEIIIRTSERRPKSISASSCVGGNSPERFFLFQNYRQIRFLGRRVRPLRYCRARLIKRKICSSPYTLTLMLFFLEIILIDLTP